MSRGLLRDLRDQTIAVLHPPDDDGRVILDQLSRIGCKTEAAWPAPAALQVQPDIVFVGVYRDSHAAVMRLLRRYAAAQPAVVAVVDYENPAMLQLVLELDALAVISKPVRSFGILTNLVIARSIRLRNEEAAVRLRKLEARLAGYRSVDKAKKILMDAQGIDEQAAYRTMRAQAMAKRIPLEEMALAIINAHSLLSSRVDDA